MTLKKLELFLEVNSEPDDHSLGLMIRGQIRDFDKSISKLDIIQSPAGSLLNFPRSTTIAELFNYAKEFGETYFDGNYSIKSEIKTSG